MEIWSRNNSLKDGVKITDFQRALMRMERMDVHEALAQAIRQDCQAMRTYQFSPGDVEMLTTTGELLTVGVIMLQLFHMKMHLMENYFHCASPLKEFSNWKMSLFCQKLDH